MEMWHQKNITRWKQIKQNPDRSIDKYMDIDNIMDMNIDINVDMYIAIEMEIGCAWHVSNVVFYNFGNDFD